MKLFCKQLYLLLFCYAQSLSAVTLYNKSNKIIRFNIFKKDFIQKGYNIDPFPKHFGKISPFSSKKIKQLDPACEYILTFYDVYNYNNNQVFTIKGDLKKVDFKIVT